MNKCIYGSGMFVSVRESGLPSVDQGLPNYEQGLFVCLHINRAYTLIGFAYVCMDQFWLPMHQMAPSLD